MLAGVKAGEILEKNFDADSMSYEALKSEFSQRGMVSIDLSRQRAKLARKLLVPLSQLKELQAGGQVSKPAFYFQMLRFIFLVFLNMFSRNNLSPIIQFYVLEKPNEWSVSETSEGNFRLCFSGPAKP
ncbi:hypothetical protein [Marinobacter arenosus]|uniref:hypothetical protein n=1 Tax=Marinobacter arenosus TaxID=2856822 RepID=UPI001C4C2874|nr:hypothetical protein [Marinobacter arenosus]MBW0149562.1 hypothetical protein [Marinobacter arenosus]